MMSRLKSVLTATLVAFFFFAAGAVAHGQSATFNIQTDYDEIGRAQVSGQQILTSDHASFYVDQDYFGKLGAVEQSQFTTAAGAAAHDFDTITYPQLTVLLGSEWSPGIDNDPKVFVLFVPMLGDVGGYFNSEDERLKSEAPHSNEHEMIYINAKHLADQRIAAFMAHEFQHLISYNQKNRRLNLAEATWLNELRSEYAPSYLGLAGTSPNDYLPVRIRDFTDSPSNSLTGWHGTAADYGVVSMFGQYLADRFSPLLFQAMTAAPNADTDSVTAALGTRGANATFDEVFVDWALTNIVNDPTVAGGIYAYKNSLLTTLRVLPTVTLDAPLNGGLTRAVDFRNIQAYSPSWLKVNFTAATPETLITIEATPADSRIGVGYVLKNWTGQTLVQKFNALTQTGLKILVPAGGATTSATLALAAEGRADSRTVIKVTLAPAPVADITNARLEAVAVSAGQPFTLALQGENIFAGAQLTVSDKTLALEPTNDPVKFTAHSTTGLAAGRYPVTAANPGRAAASIGTLTVGGSLAPDQLYSALNSDETFIVSGDFRRTLVDPRVLGLYNHLAGKAIVTVQPAERDSYILSPLVRAAGDTKVYSLDSSGVRHWLHISGEQFESSGRSWASVFTVNAAELKLYKTGPDITS